MSDFVVYLRELKKNWLYGSVLSIVLGIVLVVFPNIVIGTVGYMIAALFFLFGGTRIAAYLSGRSALLARGGLAAGFCALLLGLLILLRAERFAEFLPFMIGIVTFITGMTGLQSAMEWRRAGGSGWQGALAMSVAAAVIGVLLIVDPFGSLYVTVVFIGVSLIFDGVCDLLTAWQFDRRSVK